MVVGTVIGIVPSCWNMAKITQWVHSHKQAFTLYLKKLHNDDDSKEYGCDVNYVRHPIWIITGA